MHDVVEPYFPIKRPDELELQLRHLGVRMARARYMEAVAAAEEIMRERDEKAAQLPAKQARLLSVLANAIPAATVSPRPGPEPKLAS